MKLLVSSVVCWDGLPTPSAEHSLSLVASAFKPFCCDGNWPHYHIQLLDSAKLAGKARQHGRAICFTASHSGSKLK